MNYLFDDDSSDVRQKAGCGICLHRFCSVCLWIRSWWACVYSSVWIWMGSCVYFAFFNGSIQLLPSLIFPRDWFKEHFVVDFAFLLQRYSSSLQRTESSCVSSTAVSCHWKYSLSVSVFCLYTLSIPNPGELLDHISLSHLLHWLALFIDSCEMGEGRTGPHRKEQQDRTEWK